MREILITGGAGFIGSRLGRALSDDPDVRVTLVDNFQRGSASDAESTELRARPNVGVVVADLTEPDAYEVDIPPRQFDEVYHLAAVNGTRNFYAAPAEVLRTNTLTLIHLLDWLVGLDRKPRLMFTSSNEAYAGGLASFGRLPIPTPEGVPLVISDPYNPRWSYAASKLVGELMVIHTAKQHGIPAVIVRPHNFYGPRAGHDHVIPEFIARIVERVDPFPIYGGSETRSFCYIDDAVAAMIALMAHASPEVPTVHIGSSEETGIVDLASALFAIARWAPRSLDLRSSPAGSVARRLPDVSLVRAMTGWEATTSLRDGLRETFDWYAGSRAVARS